MGFWEDIKSYRDFNFSKPGKDYYPPCAETLSKGKSMLIQGKTTLKDWENNPDLKMGIGRARKNGYIIEDNEFFLYKRKTVRKLLKQKIRTSDKKWERRMAKIFKKGYENAVEDVILERGLSAKDCNKKLYKRYKQYIRSIESSN